MKRITDRRCILAYGRYSMALWGVCMLFLLLPEVAAAHEVAEGDKAYIQANGGPQLGLFVYLGAKHMVTGIDHVLFLLGIIFFLHRLRDVAGYVTLFAIGHSVTLIGGVLMHTQFNAYVVDAVIGLSVSYKALDNLGYLDRNGKAVIDTRAAVLIFGLFHGLGLATKLRDLELSEQGLLENLIAFNVGVEIGQLVALGLLLVVMGFWRSTASFARHARNANLALLAAGMLLFVYQVRGYFGVQL